jgi:hypothetical protein
MCLSRCTSLLLQSVRNASRLFHFRRNPPPQSPRDAIYDLAVTVQQLTRRISYLVEAIINKSNNFYIDGDQEQTITAVDQKEGFGEMIRDLTDTANKQSVEIEVQAMKLFWPPCFGGPGFHNHKGAQN